MTSVATISKGEIPTTGAMRIATTICAPSALAAPMDTCCTTLESCRSTSIVLMRLAVTVTDAVIRLIGEMDGGDALKIASMIFVSIVFGRDHELD